MIARQRGDLAIGNWLERGSVRVVEVIRGQTSQVAGQENDRQCGMTGVRVIVW